MAKDKEPDRPADRGNKSESIPNTGTAPVTTDAAATTPRPPSETDLHAMPPGTARDTVSGRRGGFGGRATDTGAGVLDDDESDPGAPVTSHAARREREKPDPADLVEGVRGFVGAIKGRQWAQALRIACAIGGRFGDMMDANAFNEHRTRPESVSARAGVLKEADSVGAELESCRNDLSSIHTEGARVNWAGGAPDPTSGSPMPKGTPPASEAGSYFDPQMVLIGYELVSRIWNHFQSNRGGR